MYAASLEKEAKQQIVERRQTLTEYKEEMAKLDEMFVVKLNNKQEI